MQLIEPLMMIDEESQQFVFLGQIQTHSTQDYFAQWTLPYLCAGGPSMMMLIHKICIALSGFGRLSTVDRVMRLKAEMLLQSTEHYSAGPHPQGAFTGAEANRNLRAQLEPDEIFYVVKYSLSLFYCIPGMERGVY